MKTAYLSLGSNLGDRAANLRQALELLAGPDLRVTLVSSLYETEPRDLLEQPRFLNLAAEIETSLFPMQLLRRVGKVEQELGRKRIVARGPRTIDIDILLYGRFQINTRVLEIPHPRMTQRRFVLEPLAEIAPDLVHPVTRHSVRQMLESVRDQGVKKLHE